ANVDFTLIEKASNKIDLIPAIRSSYGDFPSSLLIENFSNQTNAGQHIYIFSNEIHITYGLSLIACLLIGNILHHGILKIELFDVFINNMDIGGTVLSYLPSTEHQRVEDRVCCGGKHEANCCSASEKCIHGNVDEWSMSLLDPP
ncbi:16051_t:CDS:2, partial [Gigaspora rosea]